MQVRDLYLEHALELTQHEISRGADWARRGKGGVVAAWSKEEERKARALPLAHRDDELLSLAELTDRCASVKWERVVIFFSFLTIVSS